MTKTPLIPLPQALEMLQQQIVPISEYEEVSLAELTGRVLAQDITSAIDVPPFDNSAMDGYAFRHHELNLEHAFPIIDRALAGKPSTRTIAKGGCVRITTGAPIPQGFDTVVMQENVALLGAGVKINKVPQINENIRFRGKDIRAASVVIKAHTRLTPERIALIASIGQNKANVIRKIKVSIFGTGDELVEPGQDLAAGQIYNSNSYGLLTALDKQLSICVEMQMLPDEPEQIRTTLLAAAAQSDLIITSGGVSVGDADFIKQIIEELGELRFWKLAIKPGKPLAFGRIENCFIVGLPGNPVSSMVTHRLVAKPVIECLAGLRLKPVAMLKAKSLGALKKSPGRADYQRGILTKDNSGIWWVSSTGSQSSGLLSSLNAANCLIVLPIDCVRVEKEEWVDIIPLDYIG